MHKRLLIGLALCSITCSSSSSKKGADATVEGGGGVASGGNGGVGTAGTGGNGGVGGPAGKGGSGGAGGMSTGGSGGTAGVAGSGGAVGKAGAGGTSDGGVQMPPGKDTGASVLERNKNPSRDGHFVQPTLTKARAAKMALDTNFKTPKLNGQMWASPLYLENGPGDKGVFFVATTTNDVYALDETTGAIVWTKAIGNPAPTTGVGCGNIHPLGILSTPVIDAQNRTLYVAGAVGEQAIERHEVHALSVDDGKEREGWPIDVSKMSVGGVKFKPPAQNQRSALSLVNGILYVAYGGHNGDCDYYRGWVVAIDVKNPTRQGAWMTGGWGEAIWAAGGLASDGNGVLAITGNYTPRDKMPMPDHLDSEEVVRITGLGTLDRSDKTVFFPATWRQMDSVDADFGASNPVVISVPGATPSSYVVATAKDGHMYFLDTARLGGMGGQVIDFPVAAAAMAVRTAPTAYTTPAGVHVAITVDKMANCMATGSSQVVLSVLVPSGAPPKPSMAWCASISGQASPISTTTDGKNDAIVWYANGGKLRGVDGDTGKVVYDGQDSCGTVERWTSPIAVKGRLILGAHGRLCSWSPAP